MTLRELIQENPELFYRQEWYRDEAFMDVDLVSVDAVGAGFDTSAVDPRTTRIANREYVTPDVRAVALAALYLENPDQWVWREFLWTSDTDSHGNIVYVGGVGRYGCDGFQIHRHLVDPVALWVRP